MPLDAFVEAGGVGVDDEEPRPPPRDDEGPLWILAVPRTEIVNSSLAAVAFGGAGASADGRLREALDPFGGDAVSGVRPPDCGLESGDVTVRELDSRSCLPSPFRDSRLNRLAGRDVASGTARWSSLPV